MNPHTFARVERIEGMGLPDLSDEAAAAIGVEVVITYQIKGCDV